MLLNRADVNTDCSGDARLATASADDAPQLVYTARGRRTITGNLRECCTIRFRHSQCKRCHDAASPSAAPSRLRSHSARSIAIQLFVVIVIVVLVAQVSSEIRRHVSRPSSRAEATGDSYQR